MTDAHGKSTATLSIDSLNADSVDDWTDLMESINAEYDPFLTGERPLRPPPAPKAVAAGSATPRTSGITAATEAISIRVPHIVIKAIRAEAAREGVPYQTMMKRWLDDALRATR